MLPESSKWLSPLQRFIKIIKKGADAHRQAQGPHPILLFHPKLTAFSWSVNILLKYIYSYKVVSSEYVINDAVRCQSGAMWKRFVKYVFSPVSLTGFFFKGKDSPELLTRYWRSRF
jgi:hypothetical protein